MNRLVEAKRTVGLLVVLMAALVTLMAALAAPDAEAKKKKKKPRPAIPVFYLGVENAVWAVSSLVGDVDGPLLRLVNDGAGANSTGLDIRVEEGKAPLSVNPEAGTATNLNADKLDGQDSIAFLPSKTYQRSGDTVQGGGNLTFAEATCDAGDIALSGGYTIGGSNANIVLESTFDDTYTVGFDDDNAVQPNVTCADLPPLRPENAAPSDPDQENTEQSDTGQ